MADGRWPKFDPQSLASRVWALSSLMATCAFALEGIRDWNDEVRREGAEAIGQTLALGSYLGSGLSWDVDEKERGEEN